MSESVPPRREEGALYIVGAGGFGRETLDALLAAGGDCDAFLDERPREEPLRGRPVLGMDRAVAGRFVVGIADPVVRRRLAQELGGRGLLATTVLHPRAGVAPETTIGDGSVLLANAYVSSDVRIGRHVHVNYNATVGHDTVVEDFVTILPGANVGGSVRLEPSAFVGSNACILQGLRVGQGAVVGAGAVVVRDVAAGETVMGVPARPR